MTYLKTLIALTTLALLTACGGTPTATGDSSQTTDCEANPFAASCIAEDLNVEARITDCITAGNAGDTKCASLTSDTAMNTAINTCLANPFDDTCTESDFTFSTYAEMARTNRVSFCGISGNAGNALCTALTTCQANPFGATCGAYFESAKAPYCGNNPTEAPCVVNTADWLTIFTANGGTALPTTPNTTPTNEFLAITATTASTLTAELVPTTLFMTGSTTNGLAFFIENGAYYAGILAGTNLGAPITAPITSARWTGQIRADSSDSAGVLTANPTDGFGLDITFDGTKGTITTSFARRGGFVYEIDGMFDENGIITGSVDYGEGDTTSGINMTNFFAFYSPGTLTGIIGQNGAVGAFHSGRVGVTAGSSAISFSGGFVALPPSPCIALSNCVANHAAWLGSFGASPPPATRVAANAGTAVFGGFLNLADGERNISIEGLTNRNTETHLTLDGDGTDGMHGVVYLGGKSTTSHNQAFVAVLPTTNLGAPLVSAPMNAIWPGKFFHIANHTTPDINFEIKFSEQKIIATHELMITSTLIRPTNFDLRFNPATGVITGNVTDGTGSTATARGLIGTNGLVGVFVNETSSQLPNVSVLFGGFVADNPNN